MAVPVQLGGEFEEAIPGWSHSSVRAAQLVIETVRDLLPEHISELRELARQVSAAKDAVAQGDGASFRLPDPAVASLLVGGSSDWCRARNLNSQMLVWTVAATVDLWAKHPDETRIAPAPVIYVPQPVPDAPTFDPSRMTRAQHLEATKRYQDEAIAAWWASSEAAGWRVERVPRKRSSAGDDHLKHFRWFVLYQVAGRSPYRLAEEHGRQTSTVREAVEGIARLVGVPLRKQRRGRPRGSHDSASK